MKSVLHMKEISDRTSTTLVQLQAVVQLHRVPSKHSAPGCGLRNTCTNERRPMRGILLTLGLWDHRLHSWDSEKIQLPRCHCVALRPGTSHNLLVKWAKFSDHLTQSPSSYKRPNLTYTLIPVFSWCPKFRPFPTFRLSLPPPLSQKYPVLLCLCGPSLHLHLSTTSTLSSGNVFEIQLPFVFNCFSELHLQ